MPVSREKRTQWVEFTLRNTHSVNTRSHEKIPIFAWRTFTGIRDAVSRQYLFSVDAPDSKQVLRFTESRPAALILRPALHGPNNVDHGPAAGRVPKKRAWLHANHLVACPCHAATLSAPHLCIFWAPPQVLCGASRSEPQISAGPARIAASFAFLRLRISPSGHK